MTRVRVESFTISLDGYGAGPDQDIDHPLGVGGNTLHKWFFPTKTFQTMHSEMLGGGKPMFPIDKKKNLEFIESRTFSCGVVLLRYKTTNEFS